MFFKATRGCIAHIFQWLHTSFGTRVYNNPNFDRQNPNEAVSIVLVHGTADRACGGRNMAEGLLKQDLPAHIKSIHLVAFNGRLRGRGVENFSSQLITKLAAISDHDEVSKFSLIGHSRGGLVAAHATQQLGRENRPFQVVSVTGVCAPFNGSYLANNLLGLFSHSVRDMHIEGEFVTTLCQDISNNPQAQYRFIEATADWIVPPKTRSPYPLAYAADHPDSVFTAKKDGHLSATSSKQVITQIREWLEHDTITSPSSLSPVST